MRTDLGEDQGRKPIPFARFFSWQALLSSAALIVGVLGVLLTYLSLQNPESKVTIETISETNVLDLRRSVQDLDIAFRGRNVQEQNLNLRIVTIGVSNSGQVDILDNHYDREEDWGLEFHHGEVIEARLVDTNSNYLRNRVVPEISSSDIVAFPKVIFEQDKFFIVEVLVLHPKGELPTISPVGKIAGIDEIIVLNRPPGQEEIGFASRLFQGSPLIQVTRTIIYFVGSIVAMIAIILALIGITDLREKLEVSRRRKQVLQSRTIQDIDQLEIKETLIAQYELGGVNQLRPLQDLLRDPSNFMWVNEGDNLMIRRTQPDSNEVSIVINTGKGRVWLMGPVVRDLSRKGFLKKANGNQTVIDPFFSEALDSLVLEMED